ncbi:MAG: site-2 protease family protein [Planctomycetaceae bacterium]|jgi:Zn-dependent protease
MPDSDSALPPDDPEITSPEAQDLDQITGPMRRRVTSRAEPISLHDQSASSEPYIIRPDSFESAVRTPQQTLEWYRRKRRRQLWISLFLFAATVVSTTLVFSRYRPIELLPGFFDEEIRTRMVVIMERRDPSPPGEMKSFNQRYLDGLLLGFSYSGPLMLILLCHEMGHFLQAVRYRVPASFPFFIPLPIPPLGTMGAVIAQGRGAADRKQMFDIAVSGPLAGLIVTLPVLFLGVSASHVDVIVPGYGNEFGEPLIIQWVIAWIHGPTPEGQTLYMNGVAFAGWVGVFVTALNLIPIGQLDGGHLTYTLLGKPAHWIAKLLVGVAAAYMIYTGSYSYVLFLILILFMGTNHPPTRDDTVPLGIGRQIIGWLTLAFLVIGFTPTPIIL